VRSSRLLLLVPLGVLSTALPTGAVCLVPAPKVCAEFFKSAAVFTGIVVSEHEVTPPSGGDEDADEGWLFRLRVRQAFRGASPGELEVFTGNNSGGRRLEVDREYLLFAFQRNGRLEVTNCGNSGLASQRASEIRAIADLPTQPTLIEGNVAARPAWTGVAGEVFEIVGSGGSYSAFSDKSGSFKVAVYPGAYSVVPRSASIAPFDLSYDHPKHVSLESGQCAQLQFVK